MAVERWELESEQALTAPRLELVPAPPRGGRAVPAILFVALLIGALGYPAVRSVGRPDPEVIYESPRPLPASQLASLDGLRPISGSGRPMSSEPLGGILFVSCTNLWTALPDGSHARKLLAFPGASSPTFSPDARTIAFVGPGSEGQSLYMVAADGSQLTSLGELSTDGVPIDARVSNLSWSARADKLAFALVDPAYNAWGEGSTVWTLDLATGEAKRIGQGSPTPGFVERGVVWSTATSGRADTHGAEFTTTGPSARYTTKRLSTPGDDLTFGIMPSTFSDSWATKHGVVVMREGSDGDLELVTKANSWERKVRATYRAPSPYRFLGTGRVSVAQDGSRALVDLVDPKGDRSMGILDLRSGEWLIRDYAWSGIATPAPTYSGPMGAARARRLAEDFFGARRGWGSYNAAAMLIGDDDDELLEGGRYGFVLGTPARTDSGWAVPATLYARSEKRYSFQHATFEMTKTEDGRIEGEATAISPTHPLETIEDAKRFLSEVVGGELAFVWPTYLPDGAELDKRWPVDAYSYGGSTTASIHLRLPQAEGSRFEQTMSISYGDVSFGLGCGGESIPSPPPSGANPDCSTRRGRAHSTYDRSSGREPSMHATSGSTPFTDSCHVRSSSGSPPRWRPRVKPCEREVPSCADGVPGQPHVR